MEERSMERAVEIIAGIYLVICGVVEVIETLFLPIAILFALIDLALGAGLIYYGKQ